MPKPMSALEMTPSLPRGVPDQARAQDSDREGTLSFLLLPHFLSCSCPTFAEPSAPAHSFPVQQPGTSLLSPITFPRPLNFWCLQHPSGSQSSFLCRHPLEHPSPSFCGLDSI